MGHSTNPQAYPIEMRDAILRADAEHRVLEFPCADTRERVSRMLKWPAYAKALRIATTRDKDLYDTRTLQGMQDTLQAYRRLKVKQCPAPSPNYQLGPTTLLYTTWTPPIDVTGATPRAEALSAQGAALLQQLIAREQQPAPRDITAQLAARAPTERATPEPPTSRASSEEIEASRLRAEALIHKSRQAALTPHAAARYQLEHGVDREGRPTAPGPEGPAP